MAGRPRTGLYALGAALILGGLSTLGAGAQTSADDDDPLALFAELMPAFSSPRCVNCHGGTDPNVAQEGRNHDAGQVDVGMDGAGNMNVE